MQYAGRCFDLQGATSQNCLFFRLIQRSFHLGEYFKRGTLSDIKLATPIRLAGRKHLPSSDAPGIPKFLSGPREDFPLFLKAQNGRETTLTHWAKRSREVIEEAYRKYETNGSVVAILFRGLPITDAKDLSDWVNGLGYESFSYDDGTGLREDIAENVASGSEDLKEYTIEPHNEMAYARSYPKIFIISSFKTAPQGGETAIVDVRELFSKLEPSLVEKCVRKRIRYWRYLSDAKENEKVVYKTWQRQFGTESRQEVEAYLTAKGYNFEWDGRKLFVWNIKAPFINHAKSGERLWFNSLSASHCTYFKSYPLMESEQRPNNEYPFHTTYGDGEEFEKTFLENIRRATWDSAVGFQWQDGDVMFLDQLIVQHSRLGYEGERNVGISLLTY